MHALSYLPSSIGGLAGPGYEGAGPGIFLPVKPVTRRTAVHHLCQLYGSGRDVHHAEHLEGACDLVERSSFSPGTRTAASAASESVLPSASSVLPRGPFPLVPGSLFTGLRLGFGDRRADDAEPVARAEFEPARDVRIRHARIGQAPFGGRDPDLVVDVEQTAGQG
jgi:hypothetical protein